MRRHAGGLIHHDDIVVQVHDAEAVHLLGSNIGQVARRGGVHDDQISGGELVGFADLHGTPTVGDAHVPVANPPGGAGAGRVEGSGEGSVQAHAGQGVLNGEFGADALRGGFLAHDSLLALRSVLWFMLWVGGLCCTS